ncbi:hypothetical protein ACOZZ1_000474 [Vibrio fluvialis]
MLYTYKRKINSEEFDQKLQLKQLEIEQYKWEKEHEFQLKKMELDYPQVTEGGLNKKSNDLISDYYFIDINEEVKPAFSDMLKGFEDYSRTLGYEVSLSIDTSQTEKLGFKFSLRSSDKFRTTQQVQRDISEFLSKLINDTKRFEIEKKPDNPHTANDSVTAQKLKSLKRQVNDLKNQVGLFKELFGSISQVSSGSATQIFVTQQQLLGNDMKTDSRSYSADGANNVIQGDDSNIKLKNSNINIGKNVSEINTQSVAIQELIDALKAESNESLNAATRNLENIKDELNESEKPDESFISKCLSKAESIIKSADVAAGTVEKLSKVLDTFS